ncbi:MAG: hypothetical protein ACRD2T_01325 [Thermoanaerobaculia bacterium]
MIKRNQMIVISILAGMLGLLLPPVARAQDSVFVTTTGDVGIGTSTPAARLDVLVNAANTATCRLRNSNANGYPGIEYVDESGTVNLFFGLDNAANTTRLNSLNNHPIVILTNSTERARITAAGDVGFGTSAPGDSLHVARSDGTAGITVTESSTTTGPRNTLTLENNGNNSLMINDTSASGQLWQLGNLSSSSVDGFVISRQGDGVNELVVKDNGDVGIGTTAPGARLGVQVNAASAATARLQNSNANGYSGIEYLNEGGLVTAFFGLDNAANTTRLNSIQSHPIVILTESAERARITSAGSIGVGTTAPASKLHVSGGDVRVTGGNFIDDDPPLGPDYVFEPDYELMPLAELAAFVRTEKHLPNVPKAAEIKASGLNLSQFQMRLLEKIEELTLYALAQEEQLAAQQATIAELAAKVEKLEEK